MRIEINGPIINDGDQWIYDWFEIPATSPRKVKNLLDRATFNRAQEILVTINSGGGSVYAASEIYTFLKSFVGKVKVQIVGMAASAASIIAMAGYTEMSPTAMLMIHNSTTRNEGDYHSMDETSDFLQKVNRTITNAYRTKTKKTEEEVLALMNRTTWMTAGEAKEAGFIDAIMFEDEIDVVASVDNIESPQLVNGMIPKKVIDQLRQQLKPQSLPIALNQNIDVQNSNSPGANIEENEEEKTMDLQTLKNEHPDLVEQIKNDAAAEAVKAERERIKEIENIATPGTEDIVNKAKFETGVSAAETAMAILKAQKEQSATQLQNRLEDAAPLNQVDAAEPPANNNETELDNLVNKICGGGK